MEQSKTGLGPAVQINGRAFRLTGGMEVVMCCFDELARKDVINISDGCRLGYVCDLDIDVCDGRIKALVIYGRERFFGLFGRTEDIVIPWCNIQKIGEDIILVCCDNVVKPEFRRKGGFFSFWH